MPPFEGHTSHSYSRPQARERSSALRSPSRRNLTSDHALRTYKCDKVITLDESNAACDSISRESPREARPRVALSRTAPTARTLRVRTSYGPHFTSLC